MSGVPELDVALRYAAEEWAKAAQREADRRVPPMAAPEVLYDSATYWADAAWTIAAEGEARRAEVTAEAERRGACLRCLAASPWETRPRYVVHRSTDYHERNGS